MSPSDVVTFTGTFAELVSAMNRISLLVFLCSFVAGYFMTDAARALVRFVKNWRARRTPVPPGFQSFIRGPAHEQLRVAMLVDAGQDLADYLDDFLHWVEKNNPNRTELSELSAHHEKFCAALDQVMEIKP